MKPETRRYQEIIVLLCRVQGTELMGYAERCKERKRASASAAKRKVRCVVQKCVRKPESKSDQVASSIEVILSKLGQE